MHSSASTRSRAISDPGRALLGLALLAFPGLSACEIFRPFNTKGTPGSFSYDLRYPVQRLSVDNFESYAAAQEDPVWCWAACAAMVGEYYENEGRARERSSQEEAARKQGEIVQRIQKRSEKASTSEEAASQSEVLGALNVGFYEHLLATEERVEAVVTEAIVVALLEGDDSEEEDAEPEGTTAEEPSEPAPVAPPLGFDATRLYHDLRGDGRGGHPVVAALRGLDGTGHVVVVTGAHCQEIPLPPAPGQVSSPGVEYRFMALRVWDPTKDDEGATERFGGEYWLAASEFAAHCNFMASRSTAENYLAFLLAHAEWVERQVLPQPTPAPSTAALQPLPN